MDNMGINEKEEKLSPSWIFPKEESVDRSLTYPSFSTYFSTFQKPLFKRLDNAFPLFHRFYYYYYGLIQDRYLLCCAPWGSIKSRVGITLINVRFCKGVIDHDYYLQPQ